MAEDKAFVLGSDIGTGSCKTVLLDAGGRVVAAAEQGYPSHYSQPGWVEQDPEDWYRAFVNTAARVLRHCPDTAAIRALCIVGVTHNPVLLDQNQRLLRPAIHFWDRRSVAQAAAIRAHWGAAVRQRALNEVDSLWTWPQLLWIRQHEPAVWARIAHLLFAKDYVRHRLAPSLLSDTIDPVGTLLYDGRQRRWIAPFVDHLRLPATVLPAVHSPLAVVARVTERAAQETGLVAGTPVLTGTTDTAAEVLGAGAWRPGQAVVKLASVGRIMVVMERPLTAPHSFNYPHIVEDLWYPGSVTKFGAAAYRWARQVWWPELTGTTVYATMDRSASQAPPGSEGLLFHPHLDGEYAPQWDPRLRGTLVGLTTRHRRAHLTRAVLEGVAFQIRAALAAVAAAGGQYDEVRLIGGGAGSPLWAQIMADVLGRGLLVPVERSAAYGAGLMAGVATGLYPRPGEGLGQLIQRERHHAPNPPTQARYRDYYERYLAVGRGLAPISRQLADASE